MSNLHSAFARDCPPPAEAFPLSPLSAASGFPSYLFNFMSFPKDNPFYFPQRFNGGLVYPSLLPSSPVFFHVMNTLHDENPSRLVFPLLRIFWHLMMKVESERPAQAFS